MTSDPSKPNAVLTRRAVLQTAAGASAAALLAPSGVAASETGWTGGGVRVAGHSLLGAPKYGPDFSHFDYVDPAAPKGGVARTFRIGRFETFNAYNDVGIPGLGGGVEVVETLMRRSKDEGSTHYGLLAEWMESPVDHAWAAFKLRDAARWSDGAPVTVVDVRNSLKLLVEQGAAFWRFYFSDVVDVVDEGGGVALFKFKSAGNKELPHILGQLPVMPAHWWESRDFTRPILEPVLGSGPYRISNFEAGRFVALERDPNYWGVELPINVGYYNFDRIEIDFFGDRDVAFEAFKSNTFDYWPENTAKRWALQYDFPAVADGKVKREEPRPEGPQGVSGLALNQRQERFQDRRVREAFALAFDFEYLNRAVYFGQYARPTSFFQGSPAFEATGAPKGAELALLEPYRDELPPALFSEPFSYPVHDGSGAPPRRALRRARALLEAAGWTLSGGDVLKNVRGEEMRLEIVLPAAAFEATVKPFIANLRQIGVDASFRVLDPAAYQRRIRAFDFDMVNDGLANSESPGNEQREYWGSDAATRPSSRNLAGVSSPMIDALIEKIVFAEDRAALAAACKALDRVLLWEHVWIMRAYSPFDRIAYWDKFGHPTPLPAREVGFPDVWWFDSEKAAAL